MHASKYTLLWCGMYQIIIHAQRSSASCKQACMMRAHTPRIMPIFLSATRFSSSAGAGREREKLNILLCIAFTCERAAFIYTTSTFWRRLCSSLLPSAIILSLSLLTPRATWAEMDIGKVESFYTPPRDHFLSRCKWIILAMKWEAEKFAAADKMLLWLEQYWVLCT